MMASVRPKSCLVEEARDPYPLLTFRRRRILAIVALTGLILWLGSSAFVTWKLTRRSRAPFAEPLPNVARAKVEGCRLRTSDDQEIGAWLVRGDPLKACILLLHGNGESRQRMLPVMQTLADDHFTVLAIKEKEIVLVRFAPVTLQWNGDRWKAVE